MNHTISGLPSSDRLLQILEPYRNRSAYLVPMRFPDGRDLGNNGDKLMLAVFSRLLARLNIQPTSADMAEIVIVPPNGALLEVYRFPWLLAQRITGLEDKPLILFPSSAYFPTVDPSFVFNGRAAPTLWIVREPASYAHLEGKWGERLSARRVNLVLDHDVVASGSADVHEVFREKINAAPRPKHVLVAARVDVESRSIDAPKGSSPGPSPASNPLKGRVVSMLRGLPAASAQTAAARAAHRSRLVMSARHMLRRVDVSPFADLLHTARAGQKLRIVDASDPLYATFEQYLALINDAKFVVTDRLHVALPAIVLGKPTLMVEAGYHKLGGVYNHSLRSVSHAHYLSR